MSVAQYVYENVFLKYTMKQWGQTPEEISPQVTARVPVLPRQVFKLCNSRKILTDCIVYHTVPVLEIILFKMFKIKPQRTVRQPSVHKIKQPV